MTRTAPVRPDPAGFGNFCAPASRTSPTSPTSSYAFHGSRISRISCSGAQLAVRTPESVPCPGAGEAFRHAGGAAPSGLDYALSFIPAVTEAVVDASADPGTLLPGTR